MADKAMKNCVKEPCCNTCKHSTIQYKSVMKVCDLDRGPYANYLGGHSPDYLCDKYEPTEWFKEENNA